MHRLVQPQPFDIRPSQHRRAQARHLLESLSVVNSMNFAFEVGSHFLMKSARESRPTETIDHA
jgi:hypothetical protein